MAEFGGLTDHFGLATSDLIFITSTYVPRAMSRADARDENNDIAAATWFGNTAGALIDVSCTYALKSGTFDLSTLDIGELSTGVFAGSIAATTGNNAWPQVVVSGVLGAEAMTAVSGFYNYWALPAITISGIKAAQLMAFTVDAGCRLTDSSLTATCDFAQQDDALGEPAAHGLSGAVAALSASFQSITTANGWTLAGSWTETQAPSDDEPQAAYHTGTGTAEQILTRTATP